MPQARKPYPTLKEDDLTKANAFMAVIASGKEDDIYHAWTGMPLTRKKNILRIMSDNLTGLKRLLKKGLV